MCTTRIPSLGTRGFGPLASELGWNPLVPLRFSQLVFLSLEPESSATTASNRYASPRPPPTTDHRHPPSFPQARSSPHPSPLAALTASHNPIRRLVVLCDGGWWSVWRRLMRRRRVVLPWPESLAGAHQVCLQVPQCDYSRL
jgi:hypothetical protein